MPKQAHDQGRRKAAAAKLRQDGGRRGPNPERLARDLVARGICHHAIAGTGNRSRTQDRNKS